MEDLIKALQMFLKVRNIDYPTHCEHDELMVIGYTPDDFTPEELAELDKLGFSWNEDDEYFYSFRFGSC